MCDVDADRDPNLQAALDYWAAENECTCIDIESDTQFKRIWMFSVVVSLLVCLIITLPICWSKVRKDKDEDLESNPQTPSKSVDREEEDIGGPEPDFTKAKEHLRKTSATVNGKWLPVCSTHLQDLSAVGGVGTELYFRLLKRMGLCFTYMAAVTCASVSFNAVSTFAPDNGQYLAKTTIGNIGANGADTLITPDQRYIVLKYNGGCQGTPVTVMSAIIGWLDFASILIFIGFIAVFRFISVPSFARQADEEDITPKDFAVEIDKLPREYPGMEEINEEGKTKYEVELSELLCARITEMRRKEKSNPEVEDAVRVEELVLVRDFGGRLYDLKNKGIMLKDKEIAEYSGDTEKAEKLGKKIDKITTRLDKKLKPEEELPVVRAFAILSTMEDAHRLLVDYRFSVYTLMRRLQQCMGNYDLCNCCCPQRKRLFKERAIRIRPAPEPTNLIWENQDVSYLNRLVRRCIISLIFFLIVLISFGLVYAANTAAKSNMKGSGTQMLGVTECDPDMQVLEDGGAYKCFVANATAWTLDYVKSSNDDVKGCWCGTVGYKAILDNPELMNDVCRDWLLEIGYGITLAVVASGVVVVINVVCKFVLRQLAEVERPLSESALNSSKMVKIWALQTLNTGFVIFCVNYAAPDGIPFGKIIFLGEFSDAVRGWYAVVGAAVLMNMCANSVVPAATNTAVYMAEIFKRCFLSSRVKHQTELIRMYTNPPFDIAARFAQLLTVVYVTLTYSAGMPLLYFFAALYMFFTYWTDKVVLLWGSKRPPAYDTTIPREASQYMLYAVALHCVFAIWMLGQPCTFPSNPLGGTLASVASSATSTGGQYGSMAESSGVSDRLTKESTWMIFLLLLFCIGLWVLWTGLWILGGTLGELGKCICLCLCPKRSKVAPIDSSATSGNTWNEAKKRIEAVCPPASYRMERHPEFREHAELFKTGELRVSTSSENVAVFQKKAMPLEDEETAKQFLAALRDEHIKKVDQAVCKFFKSAKIQEEDQEKLALYGTMVRDAKGDDKEEAIKEIAKKMGLEMP